MRAGLRLLIAGLLIASLDGCVSYYRVGEGPQAPSQAMFSDDLDACRGQALGRAGNEGFVTALPHMIWLAAHGALHGALIGAIQGGASAREAAPIGAAAGAGLGLLIGAGQGVVTYNRAVTNCMQARGYSQRREALATPPPAPAAASAAAAPILAAALPDLESGLAE